MLQSWRSSDQQRAVSRWLRRRPQYLAAWWRWQRDPLRSPTLLTSGAALVLVIVLLARYHVVVVMAAHWPWMLVAAALPFGTATARRRDAVLRCGSRSWLAALPSAASVSGQSAAVPLALSALLTLSVFCAGLADHLRSTVTMTAVATTLCGSILGIFFALVVPLRTCKAPRPGLRGIRRPPLTQLRPSLLPLGTWVVAQAKSASSPKRMALGALILLLAVPLEASTARFTRECLVTVGAWFIAQYLLTLLIALLHAPFAAFRWLCATPISLYRFTLSLGYQVWLKELTASVLVVFAMAALLPRLSATTLWTALGWVTACVLLGIIASFLAFRTGVLMSVLHRRIS